MTSIFFIKVSQTIIIFIIQIKLFLNITFSRSRCGMKLFRALLWNVEPIFNLLYVTDNNCQYNYCTVLACFVGRLFKFLHQDIFNCIKCSVFVLKTVSFYWIVWYRTPLVSSSFQPAFFLYSSCCLSLIILCISSKSSLLIPAWSNTN